MSDFKALIGVSEGIHCGLLAVLEIGPQYPCLVIKTFLKTPSSLVYIIDSTLTEKITGPPI